MLSVMVLAYLIYNVYAFFSTHNYFSTGFQLVYSGTLLIVLLTLRINLFKSKYQSTSALVLSALVLALGYYYFTVFDPLGAKLFSIALVFLIALSFYSLFSSRTSMLVRLIPFYSSFTASIIILFNFNNSIITWVSVLLILVNMSFLIVDIVRRE